PSPPRHPARLAYIVLLCVVAPLSPLAMPVKLWRTGDQGLAPLRYTRSAALAGASPRVWIDTDAACGHADRTDPDDCLAIILLARAQSMKIVGLSTVFGNAGRDVVDRTVAQLRDVLAQDTGVSLDVWLGAATTGGPPGGVPAQDALVAALEAGPLTVVALGPLTNIAAVLQRRPELAPRMSTLIAVMGRRPGHLFHPAEGAPAGSFLGHGPVFRDFNFALDVDAA